MNQEEIQYCYNRIKQKPKKVKKLPINIELLISSIIAQEIGKEMIKVITKELKKQIKTNKNKK